MFKRKIRKTDKIKIKRLMLKNKIKFNNISLLFKMNKTFKYEDFVL